MQSKNIRLTITPIQFVGSESDIDRVPDQGRYLVLPGVTFQKMVALAESKGLKAPRRQFLPSQTMQFALGLRQALAEPPVKTTSLRGSAKITTAGQLQAFFATPANRKALARVLGFLEGGGCLDVTDE
jgi:hypothetical protein